MVKILVSAIGSITKCVLVTKILHFLWVFSADTANIPIADTIISATLLSFSLAL